MRSWSKRIQKMGAENEMGWNGMEAHSNVECRVESRYCMQVMEGKGTWNRPRKLELKLWRVAVVTWIPRHLDT